MVYIPRWGRSEIPSFADEEAEVHTLSLYPASLLSLASYKPGSFPGFIGLKPGLAFECFAHSH